MPKEFHKIKKYCENCKKLLILNSTRDIKRKRFCSRNCNAKYMHKHNIFGLKGKSLSKEHKEKLSKIFKEQFQNGRKSVGWLKYLPKKRISGRGYYFLGHEREHKILMERELDRKLLPFEVVHHIDNNKLNNSLENLSVMTRSEHTKLHLKLRRDKYVSC